MVITFSLPLKKLYSNFKNYLNNPKFISHIALNFLSYFLSRMVLEEYFNHGDLSRVEYFDQLVEDSDWIFLV